MFIFQIRLKGATTQYSRDFKFQVGIKMVSAMITVPPAFIMDVFEKVLKPYFKKHCASSPALNLLDTIKNTYYGSRKTRNLVKEPLFPHTMWNKWNDISRGEMLTSNSVETWNRNWNSTHCKGPNAVLEVILGFQREAHLTEVISRDISLHSDRSAAHTTRAAAKIAKYNGMRELMKRFSYEKCDEYIKNMSSFFYIS